MQFFKLTHPEYQSDQEDNSRNPVMSMAVYRIPGISCNLCGPWSSSDRLRIPLPPTADDFLGVRFLPLMDWKLARPQRFILHLVPFSSVGVDSNMDLGPWEKSLPFPLGGGGCNFRFNFDGLVTYTGQAGQRQFTYLQVMRTGAVEAVMTLPGTRGKDGKSTFHPYFVEENIVKALPDYLERYSQFGVATPIAILVSVLGVKGSKLPESWRHFAHRHEIDRDTLLLPDVLLREYPEDADESLPQILRPAFDALWQACGVPHSFHYDEEGCWKESFEW